MIAHAGLNGNLNNELCTECMSNMTMIEKVIANLNSDKPSQKSVLGI